MYYFSKDFDPNELSTLYIGFQRNLFTRPKEKEVLSLDHEEFGTGCRLFFERSFLLNLLKEYWDARDAGKFSSSNAASKWLRVLSLIENTYPADETEYEGAKDYFTVVKYYD